MENPIISTFEDSRLNQLKEAVYKKKVVKGIRETIRAIKKGIVQKVYLCTCEENSFGSKYTDTVKSFTISYLAQEPSYISDYQILRDIVLRKKIVEITDINSMKFREAKSKKRGPKCFCAAIIK